MQHRITINGISPIIHNSAAAMVATGPLVEEKRALAAKRGSNRTEADIARLQAIDCALAIWWDAAADTPAVPTGAIRSTIEQAARTLKHGPRVRQGLVVVEASFTYDRKRYGTTIEELATSAQFTTIVAQGMQRVPRTRAMFETPWGVEALADVDPELVDIAAMRQWLDIAGRRIGIGDWRPFKGGVYGRFEATVEEV